MHLLYQTSSMHAHLILRLSALQLSICMIPIKPYYSSSKSRAQKYTICCCNKLKYDFGADIS